MWRRLACYKSENTLKIFKTSFSRTNRPISIKLGANCPWVKETHIFLNIFQIGRLLMANSCGTNFDAPDAHFDKLCLFSDAQG
jgi:hypothetical protein